MVPSAKRLQKNSGRRAYFLSWWVLAGLLLFVVSLRVQADGGSLLMERESIERVLRQDAV